jgi:RNA12 protein
VVVIDNFLHKADNASLIYTNLSRWATLLNDANVAHVIFITNDVGYAKALATDRLLRTVTLSDKNPEEAKAYVLRQLSYFDEERRKQGRGNDNEKSTSGNTFDLDHSIRVLGGRIRDLEGLAQRLAMGVTPDGHFPCY